MVSQVCATLLTHNYLKIRIRSTDTAHGMNGTHAAHGINGTHMAPGAYAGYLQGGFYKA